MPAVQVRETVVEQVAHGQGAGECSQYRVRGPGQVRETVVEQVADRQGAGECFSTGCAARGLAGQGGDLVVELDGPSA